METQTVYMLSRGDYSDYHIVGIFSTKEKAEDYVANLNQDDDSIVIEDVEVDELSVDVRKGLENWHITMDINGDATSSVKAGYSERMWFSDNNYEIRGPVEKLLEYELHWCGWTKDKQHAVKITNEKRVQFIANNTWGKEI